LALTADSLGSNIEACLHISCDVNAPAITALRGTIDSYAPHRQRVTQKLAEAYRRQAEIAARLAHVLQLLFCRVRLLSSKGLIAI
jgi:hypothetical protein